MAYIVRLFGVCGTIFRPCFVGIEPRHRFQYIGTARVDNFTVFSGLFMSLYRYFHLYNYIHDILIYVLRDTNLC